MRRLAWFGLSVVMPICAAHAADQNFTLVNKTGYQINDVYVSESKNDSWGQDIMGRDALADDTSVDITFPHDERTCHWDLKVKYDDGSTAVWNDLNLCEINKVSIFWDAKNQVSRAVSE